MLCDVGGWTGDEVAPHGRTTPPSDDEWAAMAKPSRHRPVDGSEMDAIPDAFPDELIAALRPSAGGGAL